MEREKTKSCKRQSQEGLFACKKDKYIASFFFDDNILKISFTNLIFICLFKFS